ncbi:POU domain, class 4, transcription factor 1 [Manis javanica]|nr:POU domain, class 4, transcription factor 1 [Manis javanica]
MWILEMTFQTGLDSNDSMYPVSQEMSIYRAWSGEVEGDSPELFEGGNEEVGRSVLETQETTCKGVTVRNSLEFGELEEAW